MTGPGPEHATRSLPCGHTVAELVDLVADDGAASAEGLAAHVDTCPYCAPEVARLTEGWTLVRGAAQMRVQVPTGLTDRVLASLRGLRGAERTSPLELNEPGGRLSVAAPVLVTITRRLVAEHVLVRGGLRERGIDLDEDVLRVRIAVDYGVDINARAAELANWLRTGLSEQLGMAAPVIDIEVVDVLPNHPFG